MHGFLLGSGAFLCPVRRSSSVHPTLKLTLRINISRGAPDRYAGLSHLRYARRPEKHSATAKAWLCKVAKRYECQFLTHIYGKISKVIFLLTFLNLKCHRYSHDIARNNRPTYIVYNLTSYYQQTENPLLLNRR